MKAREIVAKLNEYLETHHPYVECDTCLNAFEDLRYLVEGFCEEEEPINWEQRRYEIAKEMLAAQITSIEFAEENSPRLLAEHAVSYADALIQTLKDYKK